MLNHLCNSHITEYYEKEVDWVPSELIGGDSKAVLLREESKTWSRMREIGETVSVHVCISVYVQ